jgi:alkylation response protein AidB-like acyl-CoA dehydrogenase
MTDAPVEDVAAFRQRAAAWLESRARRRPVVAAADTAWGQGEFSVTVFHDTPIDEERTFLAQHQAWNRERTAAGFGAITWPAEYGGAGLTKSHERAYIELEAEFDVPNDHEVVTVTSKLIAPTIDKFGTARQREKWVRRFAHCEEYCCQLFSEPGAGSDLAGLGCKAVKDGEEWVINGQKVWTSTALLAPWGFAICRTDPDVPKHAGMTAFIVPLDAPGVEVRPIRQMTGGASFNEVFLSGVRLGDDMRIGEIGEGWKVALTVLGFERASSGSGRRGGNFFNLLGLAKHLGRNSDPVIRQGLARIYCAQMAREWTRSRAAATAKRTGTAGPEGSLSKLLWTEALRQISDVAGQLLGPSMTADTGEWGTFGWNEHLLGAPGYRIAGGSDEIQRNIIGERVLGLPGEPRVDRDIPFSQANKL